MEAFRIGVIGQGELCSAKEEENILLPLLKNILLEHEAVEIHLGDDNRLNRRFLRLLRMAQKGSISKIKIFTYYPYGTSPEDLTPIYSIGYPRYSERLLTTRNRYLVLASHLVILHAGVFGEAMSALAFAKRMEASVINIAEKITPGLPLNQRFFASFF